MDISEDQLWAVVINPTSGGGNGRKVGESVLALLAARNLKFIAINENSAHETEKSLIRLMQAKKLQGVMAVGGDGLVHLLIQQLVHKKIPLLVFPAGTGNDFVRAQRFPLNNNEEILDYALAHSPVPIDLGEISGGYFADILSTGFDSQVNERANRMKFIKGPAKYNVAIALELPFFKPRQYQFTIDDKKFDSKAMLIAVANGHSYGGGMQVCPDASITDGLFDIMILKPVTKLHFIRIFPKVFSGAHVTDPAVEIHRGRKVKIESEAIAYADGERIGQLPITAEIAPGALLTWVR